MLKEQSGISDAAISARGYRTIGDPDELVELGFARRQARVPGLLLPLHTTDGGNGLYVYRPDSPRIIPTKTESKALKYEFPKGGAVRLDCPPLCLDKLGNPKVPLWITEGQKKADALASRGQCAIALLGVWNFKGRNAFGGTTVLADFDYIAFDGREVRVVFDSDVMTKPTVRQALERLTEILQRKKAHVVAVYLPTDHGKKIGVDDYLVSGHTLTDLEGLIEGPRPTPAAAAPVVALLDDAPPLIARPLALVDGKAYAAIWPYAEVTTTETMDERGNVRTFNPPRVTKERSLHIIRNDGRVWGLAGDEKLEALGLDVHLPEAPQGKLLWSTRGVKDFRAGRRPAPGEVFRKVRDVITRFMDFGLSFAEPDAMAAMLACYVLHTWFLDAFGVTGFLWINGEKGSGKSSLMFVLTELSHLGEALSPSGSFASLRDIADYGAAMGLDDAENWTNPDKTDPNTRAVILSGNRRGVTVPVKEQDPATGKWNTRRVNCYCPRIFTAIAKPDDTLSSRCLVIPLSRSDDASKANADPLDGKLWPHDKQQLTDELWALALNHLPEMPTYYQWVSNNSRLVGRDLQPWWGTLSAAAWLDANGVPGLWAQMSAIAFEQYQTEREELEVADVGRIILLAVRERLAEQPDESDWSFSSDEVVTRVHRIIEDDEIDIAAQRFTPDSVGRKLAKLRFKKNVNVRPRRWEVSRKTITRILKAHGLPALARSEKGETLSLSGSSGRSGSSGSPEKPSTTTTSTTSSTSSDRSAENEVRETPAPRCQICGSTNWSNGRGQRVCRTCHPI